MDIQILGIALANNAKMIVTCDRGIKTIIDALDLSVSVFDYADNNYLEQMVGTEVAQSNIVQ
ncbi:hypothetical protein R4796_05880 [Acinetobacter baumannii]|nr:hypothetical protein [Acinetobacter baumannii]